LLEFVSGFSLADCIWSGWKAARSIAAGIDVEFGRDQKDVAAG